MEPWVEFLNRWGPWAIIPLGILALGAFLWYGPWRLVTRLVERLEAELDRQHEQSKIITKELGTVAIVLASIDAGVKRVEGKVDRR